MKFKLIKLLEEEGILKYGNFTLRSGLTSNYYCDIKLALGNPKLLKLLSAELVKIVPKNVTAIAGSGYGGISLATLVAYNLSLPLTLVRDVEKVYGTKKTIDGYVPTKNDLVCIVDDVFTTGSSIKTSKSNLKSTKCKFAKPLVVINRTNKKMVLSLMHTSDLG